MYIKFFYISRAKITNIEATENAKHALLLEKMKKKEKEVSDFVPTNMAVNFVQHNRCKCCANSRVRNISCP